MTWITLFSSKHNYCDNSLQPEADVESLSGIFRDLGIDVDNIGINSFCFQFCLKQ